MSFRTRPAGPDDWSDVASVLGPGGGLAGCWCMFWRLSNREIHGNTAQDNRAALHALVCSGRGVGLVGYEGDLPVGWCAVAPRSTYLSRLTRTRGLELPGDVDDPTVWSVVCIFVRRGHRRTGVAGHMLSAAVAYSREQDAAVLEGYPHVDAGISRRTRVSSGTVNLFLRAGFTEHSRNATGGRVVMRRVLNGTGTR